MPSEKGNAADPKKLGQAALARPTDLLYSYLRVNVIGIRTCSKMTKMRTGHNDHQAAFCRLG
jgi:hypothetical protein